VSASQPRASTSTARDVIEQPPLSPAAACVHLPGVVLVSQLNPSAQSAVVAHDCKQAANGTEQAYGLQSNAACAVVSHDRRSAEHAAGPRPVLVVTQRAGSH
jgi:hypothetical protein